MKYMALKQRYTVTVAGYEMNVRSDNTPAEVEEIVGALDRGIRDVCARNRNLPRNEAIILCALDAYSEKRKAQQRVRELENDLYGGDGKFSRLERENELLRAYIERRTQAAKADAAGKAAGEADIKDDGDMPTDGGTDGSGDISR